MRIYLYILTNLNILEDRMVYISVSFHLKTNPKYWENFLIVIYELRLSGKKLSRINRKQETRKRIQ